jgi:hypothetical protein
MYSAGFAKIAEVGKPNYAIYPRVVAKNRISPVTVVLFGKLAAMIFL